MADEVTDLSNREQFVVCLCWVDNETFNVSEDLIGLFMKLMTLLEVDE